MNSGEQLSRSARQWIEAHYMDKFSLERLAGALYVNGSYLLRVFKANTGMTLLAYHNRYRCIRAAELLVGTRKSVSEIADACGFISPSHFSHVFRRVAGISPAEYRNTAPAIRAEIFNRNEKRGNENGDC